MFKFKSCKKEPANCPTELFMVSKPKIPGH